MTVLTVLELSSQDNQRYWPKGQVDFDGSNLSAPDAGNDVGGVALFCCVVRPASASPDN